MGFLMMVNTYEIKFYGTAEAFENVILQNFQFSSSKPL